MDQVRKVPERSRYEILEGENVAGYAEYQVVGEKVILPHTVVETEYGGRGLGGKLVQGALEDIRSEGKKVVPACSFVAHWIQTHPEEADLVSQ